MRWFRMYAEAIDDPKLRLLAFEDRWHYVALLCMKAEGMLDDHKKSPLLDRMVAAKLGLASRDADEARRRLMEVELITETWQPIGWDRRQYVSDNSTDRVRKFRSKKQPPSGKKRSCNVSETPPDTDTDTDSSTKKARKSPWGDPPQGVDPEAWSAWTGYKGGRPKPATITALRNLLSKHPTEVQRKAVEHSIANGYAGLFPEKFANEKPNGTARGAVRVEDTLANLRRIAGDEEGGAGVDSPHRDVRGQVYDSVCERTE